MFTNKNLSFLKKNDSHLKQLLQQIIKASQEIYSCLKEEKNLHRDEKTFNHFGEKQINIDILADKIIQKHITKNKLVNSYLSEESKKVIKIRNGNSPYFVGYDPLDGSSLIKNNQSLGSIFGIWQTNEVMGKKGKELVAAFYAIYGINLEVVVTTRNLDVTHLLFKKNKLLATKKLKKLKPISRNFSFGNLRACSQNKKLKKTLNHFIIQEKTLRYTGCLVADFHKIITDQQGVFIYVKSSQQLDKLRLIYECIPLSFIAQKLNGLSVNQKGKHLLDTPIDNYHQTSSIIIGSKKEVIDIIELLN